MQPSGSEYGIKKVDYIRYRCAPSALSKLKYSVVLVSTQVSCHHELLPAFIY